MRRNLSSNNILIKSDLIYAAKSVEKEWYESSLKRVSNSELKRIMDSQILKFRRTVVREIFELIISWYMIYMIYIIYMIYMIYKLIHWEAGTATFSCILQAVESV